MSSGVSDQMKVPGNTAKNVEEQNIPWSQQVDEASYENLASPTADDNFATNQSSMQFQYPPFNAKENQNISWNSYKSRKTTNNFEINKKHSKPAFYNNKRDDIQANAWGTHNARKVVSDNFPGNFNRSNKADECNSPKLDNRACISATVEEKKLSSAAAVTTAPKKTTWASIASQPAKLTSRTTLNTSSHKKKGPGMPPPPMVPGKHNLDVNTWDLPNNNPLPIPSPPLPPLSIDQAYCDINSDFTSDIVGEQDKTGGVHVTSMDYSRDGNKFSSSSGNSGNNFGRMRSSPNGHSRKNWPTQHPLQQQRQVGGLSGTGGIITVSARRGGVGDNNLSGHLMKYSGDRRGHNISSRSEQQEPSNLSNDTFRDGNNLSINTLLATNTFEELPVDSPQAVLDELRDKNNYNPGQIDLDKAATARFFVIKSYSEDDIHRSIKYEIWCSTDHGNKRLDDAFKERHKEGGNVLLFFSVNGSGHFCGMAQMMTAVDYNSTSSVWSQDKWKGKFKVKWIYVKDVPNMKLRHIRLENNDNKAVTNSRDTQEVPNERGIEVLKILHAFKHSTSIFDDFYHYEKKQEEEVSSKKQPMHESMNISQTQSPAGRHNNRQIDERERDRDRDKDNRSSNVSGLQKWSTGSSAFRDRNTSHRGGYHNNYNDHRRFDSHRNIGDYHQQRDRDTDLERDRDWENSEYGSRNPQKLEYNQRVHAKQHITRDREFSEDHSKNESRFRPREISKDIEYPNSDRTRCTDY